MNFRKTTSRPMRVVFFGLYDMGKPRVRLLLDGLKSAGVEVTECYVDLWEGIEDKHFLLKKLMQLALRFLYSLLAYPFILFKYATIHKHDIVIVPYPGYGSVPLLWPFAKLRNVPMVLDAFIPLYETIVDDRQYVSARSITAKCLYALEWMVARLPDLIISDTQTHALFYEQFFGLPSGKVKTVYVGAETSVFVLQPPKEKQEEFKVLFYGQFVPLHGIDVIVKAFSILERNSLNIKLVMIGRGQEEDKIRHLMKELDVKSIDWIPWVFYNDLPQWIGQADVCLGIFGTTQKGQRVIPNKVFQALACGRPLITSDTPAIREWLKESPGVKFIPSGNPQALAAAICEMKQEGYDRSTVEAVGPQEIGIQMKRVIEEFLNEER